MSQAPRGGFSPLFFPLPRGQSEQPEPRGRPAAGRDAGLAPTRLLGPSPPSARSPTLNLLTFLPATPYFGMFCAMPALKSQPHLGQFLLSGSLNPRPLPPIISSGQPVTAQEPWRAHQGPVSFPASHGAGVGCSSSQKPCGVAGSLGGVRGGEAGGSQRPWGPCSLRTPYAQDKAPQVMNFSVSPKQWTQQLFYMQNSPSSPQGEHSGHP